MIKNISQLYTNIELLKKLLNRTSLKTKEVYFRRKELELLLDEHILFKSSLNTYGKKIVRNVVDIDTINENCNLYCYIYDTQQFHMFSSPFIILKLAINNNYIDSISVVSYYFNCSDYQLCLNILNTNILDNHSTEIITLKDKFIDRIKDINSVLKSKQVSAFDNKMKKNRYYMSYDNTITKLNSFYYNSLNNSVLLIITDNFVGIYYSSQTRLAIYSCKENKIKEVNLSLIKLLDLFKDNLYLVEKIQSKFFYIDDKSIYTVYETNVIRRLVNSTFDEIIKLTKIPNLIIILQYLKVVIPDFKNNLNNNSLYEKRKLYSDFLSSYNIKRYKNNNLEFKYKLLIYKYCIYNAVISRISADDNSTSYLSKKEINEFKTILLSHTELLSELINKKLFNGEKI